MRRPAAISRSRSVRGKTSQRATSRAQMRSRSLRSGVTKPAMRDANSGSVLPRSLTRSRLAKPSRAANSSGRASASSASS
jgi:hypothetical protein